jgi:hypothetical protein
VEIKLPEKFCPESIPDFQHVLENTLYENKVNVDFSTLWYSYPMGMLVVGSYFRRWIKIRKEKGLSTTKSGIKNKRNVHSYLKHLGFFDYAGMSNVGNEVGTAKGNTRYVPIREIKRSELEESIMETGERLVDAIVFTSNSIANVLSGTDASSEGKKAFSYTIREILRNVFEHSGADSCFVCGQRWVNGKAEIAIIDEGIGVFNSLSAAYTITENDILSHAIKPGVTRTHGMSKDENIYGNSGFGLYVLSELGSSFGWFSLGSGEKKITYKKCVLSQIDLPFQGTFVGLHLESTPKNFAGVLQDIIASGEDEAENEGRYSVASEISKRV